MGRTLDYEFSYGEEIVITPRRFPIALRHGGVMDTHYAIIGTAHVADGYPLYYDAVNEKGLGMAGLNFVGSAQYAEVVPDRENIAQFEFIPRLLGRCATLAEAREALRTLNLTGTPFSPQLPAAQLHWLLADKSGAVVIESVADGLKVYDNPSGVLTNNPPFPQQMFALNNLMHLSPKQPENLFSDALPLTLYSRGMGALGLPGDLSSSSRFVRASYVKMNSRCNGDELSSVSQFFHILGSVDQQRGCCEVAEGKYEITLYTSCCNATKGIYYYTTYDNHQISAVDMHKTDLNGQELARFTPVTTEQIHFMN
jgi:choloylglycine hydrolase